MKKHILPLLTAVGISAVGAAGLSCVMVFLSCFVDGDPKAHPVAFPVSVLAGLTCLALFVLLICCYVRQRGKAPSALWTLTDAALALVLALPFLDLWLHIVSLVSA